MAGRPPLTLQALVRTGGFRARRESHRALLLGPPLPWRRFSEQQGRFAAATSEPERRACALEFQRLVQAGQREYARRSAGSDPAQLLAAELAGLGKPDSVRQLLEFFPYYYAHPKGRLIGQPFRLEPWQKRFLREFTRRDRQGRRVYRSGVLGVPRGNGKTPLAAGLGVYELLTRRDAPDVLCAAGSKEQAAIALGFARSFVEQGPLAEWVTVKSSLSCPASHGLMQVISSEGKLQHGRMPAAALIDELWAFETERERQTFTAMSSALHKRDDAWLLAISTAGYDKQSLLGSIYEQAFSWPDLEQSKDGCLTIAKDVGNGQLLWWYGAPAEAPIDDPKIWRASNPASWIQLHDLKRQLADPGLGESEFRRLHLNGWTRSRDAWLPDGCWHGLRSEHEIPDGAPIYVGVDVGLVHDSTAVAWAHTLEDGRTLLRVHVWSASQNTPAHEHPPGGKVRLEEVEQFIRELGQRHEIRQIAYDPRFFDRSAEILADCGFTMVEFLQASAPMRDAVQRFYQLALEGKLTHNGDPILSQHIEATAAVKSERGWKLLKLKSSQRIDATVAAVLAVAHARHHKPGDDLPQIYWLDLGPWT
jgi:phage terminase large subunit-like protein